MTESDIDVASWRVRLADLEAADVTAAVIVQCGPSWLLPEMRAFRNEVEKTLMTAQLRRGPALTITRVILHNLPLTPYAAARPTAVDEAFEEWQHRLSATSALLCTVTSGIPRIHRLILNGNEAAAAVPDMVELSRDHHWTDPQRAELVLRAIDTLGATTPLTGYDLNLDGPFGDADPSIHM